MSLAIALAIADHLGHDLRRLENGVGPREDGHGQWHAIHSHGKGRQGGAGDGAIRYNLKCHSTASATADW
jgi:hypothetical protein